MRRYRCPSRPGSRTSSVSTRRFTVNARQDEGGATRNLAPRKNFLSHEGGAPHGNSGYLNAKGEFSRSITWARKAIQHKKRMAMTETKLSRCVGSTAKPGCNAQSPPGHPRLRISSAYDLHH
eukprot:1247688-Rhodomonas_salina.2